MLAAVALVVTVWPRSWRVATHAITAAHEGAHGLAALLTGRRQRGITLQPRHLGARTLAWAHARNWPDPDDGGGYPGPALLGLGAAALLSLGHAAAVLWSSLVLLALLLLQVRNVWGGVDDPRPRWRDVLGRVVGCAGDPIARRLRRHVVPAPRGAAVGVGARAPAPPRTRGSDADALARLTPLPAGRGVGAFLASTLGALWVGGGLLLA